MYTMKWLDFNKKHKKTCNAILLLDSWQWSKCVKLEVKTAAENNFQFLLEEDVDFLKGAI